MRKAVIISKRIWDVPAIVYSDEAIDLLEQANWSGFRTDLKLIDLMETKGAAFVQGEANELKVVTFPDEATDYEVITTEDGSEEVVYVLNGKIRFIW